MHLFDEPVKAAVTDTLARRSFKLRGKIFYAFAEICAEWELATAPRLAINEEERAIKAILIYIFIHPTPIQVYEYIPRLAVNNSGLLSNFKLSYTRKAIDQVRADNSSLVGNYSYYPNDSGTLSSCATRVFNLLGIQWEHSIYDAVDPAKFGVIAQTFSKYIRSSWHPKIQVIVYSYDYDQNLPAHIDWGRSDKELLLFVYNDHVSYAMRKDVFYQLCRLGEDLQNHRSRLAIKEVRDQLKSMYPPNKGRAGGKVFLDFDEVLPAIAENPVSWCLAEKLITADNDWEQVAGLAILLIPYVSLAGEDIGLFLLQNYRYIFKQGFTDYIKICKAIQQYTRMNGALPSYLRTDPQTECDRAWANQLYGLDVIGGRSELMHLDFTEETVMRLIDPALRAVPTYDIGERRLYMSHSLYEKYEDEATEEAVREVIKDAGDGVTLEAFDSWFDRRMYWGASGGAPGATITWRKNNEKLRVNKRGALLSIPKDYIKKVMGKWENAVQWSVKALKFESGKLRSILNTSIESYVIQAFVLDNFDKNTRNDTWYSSAHDMTARIANTYRRIGELERYHGLMWDFADFNINHTFRGMIKLFNVTVKVLQERGEHATPPHIYTNAVEDLGSALKWIRVARENTYVKDNDTGFISKLVRSLQSGERATSFVNAMRNHIDYLIVRKTAHNLFSRPFLQKKGDKQGDDVFLPVANAVEATLACAIYNITGAAGQLSKITNDYHQPEAARGEYLRYAYDGKSRIVSGYPIRAMMGVIHGEFFDEPIPKPLERAATFMEQFAKLQRRGWIPPPTLLERIIKRNCHLVYTDNGTKNRVVPKLELVTLPAIFGGIGVTETISGAEMVQSQVPPQLTNTLQELEGYIAIYIPSGEGKTTLAKKLGKMVALDHDELVGPAFLSLRERASSTGDWKPVNRYLRECARGIKGRVLLTWGPDTAPAENRLGEYTVMLRKPTALRANRANRAALLKSKRNLKLCDNWAQMFACVVDIMLTHGRLETPKETQLKVRIFESEYKPPKFMYPRVAATDILRRAKTHLADYDAVRSFGIAETSFIDEAALESALTAAYPKDPLYQAIADYAKKLDKWQRTGRFVERTVNVPKDNYNELGRLVIYQFLNALGIVPGGSINYSSLSLNVEGYPITERLTHFYNCIDRITALSGCSLGLVVRRLIDKQDTTKYSGNLGKLYSFLVVLEQRKESLANLSLSYKETDTIKDIRLFIDSTMANQNSDSDIGNRVFEYIVGQRSLLPPYNPGVNAEIISAIRASVLVVIENHYKYRITLEPIVFALWVQRIEFAALIFFFENYQQAEGSVLLLD
uniref:RNA-directed RNA polymerase n=1 Tax=Macrophomina phaseolina fusagravirus 3 TaxID=2741669 RepID=A0A7S5WLX4_9VIRU|nr:RNA-dependent RNA polymerase [Macrophomina phaseolina fusagravirus 3]